MKTANYCRCPLGWSGGFRCPSCGRLAAPDQMQAVLRDAGLVVDRNPRSAARRRSASVFLILLGGALAAVGHGGDEFALTAMGIAVAAVGVILAAVPGAIRLMATFANSRSGRISVAACILAVVALAFLSTSYPAMFR